MAFLEDFVGNWGWGTSSLVGLGAVLLAPPVFTALGRILRPVAKGMIWGTVALAENVRGLAAEANEQVRDLYAEAWYEYKRDQMAQAATATSQIITPEAKAPASAAPLVTPEGKPITER